MKDILSIGAGDKRLSEKRIRDIHKQIIVPENAEEMHEVGRWKETSNHSINYRGEKFEFTPPFWVSEGGEKDIYNQYLSDVQLYRGDSDMLYGFLAGLVERSLQITLDVIQGKDMEDIDE